MKKIAVFLFFVLVLFCKGLTFAEIKDCRIGADPVNPNMSLAEGEMEYQLLWPTIVTMKGGNGKQYQCRLSEGETLIVDMETTKVKRIKRCGNDLVSELYVEQRTIKAEPLKKEKEPERYAEYPSCPNCSDVNVYCPQPQPQQTTTTAYIPYYALQAYPYYGYGYGYGYNSVYLGIRMGDYYGGYGGYYSGRGYYDRGYYRDHRHTSHHHYSGYRHRDHYRPSSHPSPPRIPR